MRLSLDAPAKINLYLKILGTRPDGYHDLLTLMQPLDLADRLDFSTRGRGIAFSCDREELNGEDNLVVAAARAFFAASGVEGGVDIHLTKRIPVAAGLGGGSSDAANTLLGLNALFGSVLPVSRLVGLAGSLGADVPFFLAGCPAMASGIGDRVEPLPNFPQFCYVLVNPNVAVTTAWVYQQYDLTWTSQENQSRIAAPIDTCDAFDGLLLNDLERVTLPAYPVLSEIKKSLLDQGAAGALMSGSGPTVFGLFGGRAAAQAAAENLARAHRGFWVRVCQGTGGGEA